MAGPTHDTDPQQQPDPAQSAPAPQQPAPSTPAQPAAKAGPGPLDALLASMSRAELAILAGAALLILLDVISWFASGFGFTNIIVAGALVSALLILARNSLPAAVAGAYPALLFVFALMTALMGARTAILSLLQILQPPAGASPEFLLNFVGLLAGSAAIAYGVFMLWKGRSA
jgi:hypothetical protein